jgi:hypothetical protein
LEKEIPPSYQTLAERNSRGALPGLHAVDRYVRNGEGQHRETANHCPRDNHYTCAGIPPDQCGSTKNDDGCRDQKKRCSLQPPVDARSEQPSWNLQNGAEDYCNHGNSECSNDKDWF